MVEEYVPRMTQTPLVKKPRSCHCDSSLESKLDNFLTFDNDNDHSFSQLPKHKALTCPEGQLACAVGPHRLVKEIRSYKSKFCLQKRTRIKSKLKPTDTKSLNFESKIHFRRLS